MLSKLPFSALHREFEHVYNDPAPVWLVTDISTNASSSFFIKTSSPNHNRNSTVSPQQIFPVTFSLPKHLLSVPVKEHFRYKRPTFLSLKENVAPYRPEMEHAQKRKREGRACAPIHHVVTRLFTDTTSQTESFISTGYGRWIWVDFNINLHQSTHSNLPPSRRMSTKALLYAAFTYIFIHILTQTNSRCMTLVRPHI